MEASVLLGTFDAAKIGRLVSELLAHWLTGTAKPTPATDFDPYLLHKLQRALYLQSLSICLHSEIMLEVFFFF